MGPEQGLGDASGAVEPGAPGPEALRLEKSERRAGAENDGSLGRRRRGLGDSVLGRAGNMYYAI